MDEGMRERVGSDSAGHSAPIPLRVLILDDNPHDIELCIRQLNEAGFELQADAVDNEERFAERLQSRGYDLVLADYGIPAWSGVEAFHLLKQSGKDVPFILVTGILGEEAAIDLIKDGVSDCILKDRLARLPLAVRRALKEKSTRDEREQAVQALRESEERVRLLLDSTAEAIYGISGQGSCTFCNAASLRLLGYDRPDNLLGKQMHRLIHHTRANGTPYPIAECDIHMGFCEGRGSHADDELLWRKDGSCFPAECWSYPMLLNGEPIGSVVTFLDITERKAAATHLLQKVEELNRSNVELEQIAYIASHDLQEPLRMVASYTQLLAKRYKGKLGADADEFISFAVDGANRMQQLIQDLLTYSRVGTKGTDLRATSSEESLQQALRNLRGAIEESGAEVTHDPLPAIMADEMQLIQLFQNLIGNAIKYRSHGVPRVHISAVLNGERKWEFSVNDNGLGIDPQYFERIFRMFQRLHKREEFAGSGIGLAVCKKIVERHGGNISVESQPGKGSTFRFVLAEIDNGL
jgi:PAS domain S-box-containing protein